MAIPSPGPTYTDRQPPRAAYAYLLEEWKMELEKRADGWWITGVPDTPDCGPYDRKVDAESDRRGMARFYRHADERDFFTVDRQSGRGVVANAVSAPGR